VWSEELELEDGVLESAERREWRDLNSTFAVQERSVVVLECCR